MSVKPGVPCCVDPACDLAHGTPLHVPVATATVSGIIPTVRADALLSQGFDTPTRARRGASPGPASRKRGNTEA